MIKYIIITALILVLAQACTSDKGSFELVVDQLLTGSVPVISPQEISERDISPVFIDSRSQEEFQVSHIDGAIFVDYENFDAEELQEVNPSAPVVVYCTMGYRSEKTGEKLRDLGYTNVYNLYGGIIQWKNDGYSVVDNMGMQTDSVHGYSKAWGHWLKNGIAVYE